MKQITKQLTLYVSFLLLTVFAYHLAEDFAGKRMARLQNTNYNFSRYLRS